MQLQFLGTGAGMPSKARNTTAIALKLLEENGSVWLFDCGEATQHQILHTTLRPRKIDKIFITHMHGDHIFGLPGFLSSRSFLGGDTPLTLFGPKGLQHWVETTLALSKTHITYPITYVTIEPGIIYEDELFTVHADLLQHVIPCYGFRIEQKSLAGELSLEKALALGVPKGPLLGQLKAGQSVQLADGRIVESAQVVGAPKRGKVITILGDTKYCDAAIRLSNEADIVVHEATFNAETGHLAGEYGHATNVEAAQVARRANAKHLILTHISARFLPSEMDALVAEARDVFPQTYMASDFTQFAFEHQQLVQSRS